MKPDKRLVILRAAESVFRGRRFHEVLLDDVAAAARVGKGTIYRYFNDKEDLFFQIVVDGFRELEESLARVAASEKPVHDKLYAFGDVLTGVLKERHMIIPAIMTPEFARKRPDAREEFHRHHQALDKILADILQEGIRTGTIRNDVNIDLFLCAFVGGMHGLTHRHRDDGLVPPVHELIDLLLKGARNCSNTRVRGSGFRKSRTLIRKNIKDAGHYIPKRPAIHLNPEPYPPAQLRALRCQEES